MARRRNHEAGRGPVRPGESGRNETLGSDMTVVGRGTQLEGTLVSAESIRIDGQAKGKIAARGDVILSSQSRVEAEILAQNVVMGGTLKGNVTARINTEVADGGRVEGRIRSKRLVVREGAVFSGQSDIGLDDAPSDRYGLAFPEDELRMAYGDAARRAAEWYRSRLPGPNAGPDHDRAAEPDASAGSDPDESAPRSRATQGAIAKARSGRTRGSPLSTSSEIWP